MKALPKSKAIEKLTRQIQQIEGLNRESQEFVTWQRQTEMLFENIFRDNQRYIKEFTQIQYSPNAVYHGMPASASARAFQGGLNEARALLEAGIHEIQDFWEEDVSQDDSEMNASSSFLQSVAYFHPYIQHTCAKLFQDGHYLQAVETSVKAVFQYIRDITGVAGDGTKLVQDVFSEQAPYLRFNDLSNQSQRNEQIGFMDMLKAYYKGIRNPTFHGFDIEQDEPKAYEHLAMASLFCRRIDDAKAFTDQHGRI